MLHKINGVTFGFHRMSSSCLLVMGASGGVTFMRVFLVSDPEYLLHRLLALRLDKLSRFVYNSELRDKPTSREKERKTRLFCNFVSFAPV